MTITFHLKWLILNSSLFTIEISSWMTFILQGYPMFFKQPKFSWNHGSLAKRPKFQREPWSLKQMLPNYQGNIVPMRNGPKFIINHASKGNGWIPFKNHISLRQMDPSFSRNHVCRATKYLSSIICKKIQIFIYIMEHFSQLFIVKCCLIWIKSI